MLLLPGTLGTAAFFDDLMAEPRLIESSIRLVATTLPGFGNTAPPDDLSMENYAHMASRLAADLGCDAVLGHSTGANVALEMAASGGFSGPLLLLSPSLSREDEPMFARVLDRLSRVLGSLPFALALKMIGVAMKSSLPANRRDALMAELKTNDPGFARNSYHRFLEYLDHHGQVVRRLCGSGVRAWVVFGEHHDVGLKDEERRELDRCPCITFVTIPGAGHFTLNQEPGRIAELVLQAVSAGASR